MIVNYKPKPPQINTCRQNKVAFSGKTQALNTFSTKGESWYVRTSAWFARMGGERFANLVNAGGKFAIAPLLIAFNPFSEEDKETRIYSAWKQPIEAVLTITAQLAALSQIDNYLDKLSIQGKLAKDYNIKNLTVGTENFNFTNKKLGVLKDRISILAALAAVPVITTITNWAYPRVMKKILPEAYAKKKGEV